MTRENVYKIIDGEREYQDQLSKDPNRPDILPLLSTGETLSVIQHCIDRARAAWYKDSSPYSATTNEIRKIAALSVACMERYGAPERIR